MRTSAKVLFVSLAVVGALCILLWRVLSPTDSTPASNVGTNALAAGSERKAAVESLPTASTERHTIESDAPVTAAAKTSTPPRAELRVRGRTLDLQGAPIPGVHVGTRESGKPLGASDATGTFELQLPAGTYRLVAVDDAWVTVRYDLVGSGDPDRERFLIVAPSIDLAGRVIDGAGRPVSGASVRVETPLSAFVRFPLALDSTGIEGSETKSAADGSFELKRAPAVVRAQLETSYTGLKTDERPLPQQSVSDLVIALKDPTQEGAVLEGIVVHEDGKPAPGAEVHLSASKATADADGRFRLAFAWVDPSASLVAVLRGFQAAVVPEYGRVIQSNDRHPPPARLVLGPAPLSIAGRIVGADGKPQAGWTVSLADGA